MLVLELWYKIAINVLEAIRSLDIGYIYETLSLVYLQKDQAHKRQPSLLPSSAL
jgi:hypothetical protein